MLPGHQIRFEDRAARLGAPRRASPRRMERDRLGQGHLDNSGRQDEGPPHTCGAAVTAGVGAVSGVEADRRPQGLHLPGVPYGPAPNEREYYQRGIPAYGVHQMGSCSVSAQLHPWLLPQLHMLQHPIASHKRPSPSPEDVHHCVEELSRPAQSPCQ